MCAQINVMSLSNKCWQCETMRWETQAGRLESLHGSKMELKTAAGCRPALARALVGAKAAWSQESSNSVLRPAQKSVKTCWKLPTPPKTKDWHAKLCPTMLYMTSIWLALTGTICINTPWCFFLKNSQCLEYLGSPRKPRQCWIPCLWCLLVLLLAHWFNFWSSSPELPWLNDSGASTKKIRICLNPDGSKWS